MNKQIMEIEIEYSMLLSEHAARAVFKGDSPEEVKRLSDEWQAEWDRISAEREEKIREIKEKENLRVVNPDDGGYDNTKENA